jgi:hypothetical protein
MASPADEETGYSKEVRFVDGANDNDELEPLLPKAAVEVPECGGTDIVQFSAPMYYADETEKCIQIDIIRLGSTKGRIAVTVNTHDGSAVAGEQYLTTSSWVVWKAEKSLRISRCQSLKMDFGARRKSSRSACLGLRTVCWALTSKLAGC